MEDAIKKLKQEVVAEIEKAVAAGNDTDALHIYRIQLFEKLTAILNQTRNKDNGAN